MLHTKNCGGKMMKGRKNMAIKNIGEIRTGLVSETDEGVCKIHTLGVQFPIVEVYGNRDENGKLLDDDADVQATADELAELWNRRVRGEI